MRLSQREIRRLVLLALSDIVANPYYLYTTLLRVVALYPGLQPPYPSDVYRAIKWLWENGFIDVSSRVSSRSEYVINDSGRVYLNRLDVLEARFLDYCNSRLAT